MGYTKEQMVDQVYLAVTGGQPSSDVNIQRADINSLLPAAVSEVIRLYNQEERRNVTEEIRLYGSAGGAGQKINHQFLTTYRVTPQKDSVRGLYYLQLPARVQTLHLNRGVDDVYPIKGFDRALVKVASHREIIGLPGLDTVFYWYEDVNEDTARIYFNDLAQVCDYFVKIVVSIDDLDDSDNIPMPSGLEFRVIDLLTTWFLQKQRGVEADDISDDQEEGEQVNERSR